MNTIQTTGLALALASLPLGAQAPTTTPPTTRPVDLAICLDTSGSMDGLIDAARQNIWAIVNDLALAQPQPQLRIALLTFGNDGHDPARGWVEIATPFTTDLDLVSMKLFALTTNGGTELVGRVTRTAVDELGWSEDPHALKILVVAGNESAEQDQQVDFRTVCKDAATRGIVIDSIYCGDPDDALAPAWRELATRADGAFAHIAKDGGAVAIASPFDAALTALGTRLNATYIPFGASGASCQQNQSTQDWNAAQAHAATSAERAVSKATANYSCASWDLVDALAQGQVELATLDRALLPEPLRALAEAELRAEVDRQQARRAALQVGILALREEREAFVTAELQRLAAGADAAAFEFAVRRAVRAQAEARGFRFDGPRTVAGG
jgi:hypothetical protein